MSINFDILIDTPEYAVDMKSGLDTLQGVSDATRTIAASLLADTVIKRKGHKSKVRTKLKQTFKGSYGHIYSLEVYDEVLKNKLAKIGKATFAEIMTYFISESLYLEHNDLSKKAEKVIDKYGANTEKLIEYLRESALENIHASSIRFNHEVKISFRQSRNKRTEIATFNKKTAKALEAKLSDDKISIVTIITRFNIFTGNGRLNLKDATETVAFAFGVNYDKIKIKKYFLKI